MQSPLCSVSHPVRLRETGLRAVTRSGVLRLNFVSPNRYQYQSGSDVPMRHIIGVCSVLICVSVFG